MSKDKIYPKGVSFFSPKQGAPTWVKGNIVIQPNDLFQFLKDNPSLLVRHEKYGEQLKLTVTDNGVQVDTWKPEASKTQDKKSDFPI